MMCWGCWKVLLNGLLAWYRFFVFLWNSWDLTVVCVFFLDKYSKSRHSLSVHLTCSLAQPSKILHFGKLKSGIAKALTILEKLPDETVHLIFRHLTVFQLMTIYHHTDLKLFSANKRLKEFWEKNEEAHGRGTSYASRIYRALANMSDGAVPATDSCNSIFVELNESLLYSAKKLKVGLTVLYEDWKKEIVSIEFAREWLNENFWNPFTHKYHLSITINNSHPSWVGRQSAFTTLEFNDNTSVDSPFFNYHPMFYEKKTNRLYYLICEANGRMEIRYVIPGQSKYTTVVRTRTTVSNRQIHQLSVSSHHVYLASSYQAIWHKTDVMYVNLKTKERWVHCIQGHLISTSQQGKRLMVECRESLTLLNPQKIMKVEWDEYISGSIQLDAFTYVFSDCKRVKFARFDQKQFIVHNTRIMADDSTYFIRCGNNLFWMRDKYYTKTCYIYEIFDGALICNRVYGPQKLGFSEYWFNQIMNAHVHCCPTMESL